VKQFFKLPRRLATVLPTPYSSSFLNLTKDFTRSEATQSPLLTLSRNLQPFWVLSFPKGFLSCKERKGFWKGFAPAAPHKALIHVFCLKSRKIKKSAFFKFSVRRTKNQESSAFFESQNQSPGYLSQDPYRLSACWVFTPTTT